MLKGTFGRLMRGGQGAGDEAPANLDTPGGRLTAIFREIDNTSAARRLTMSIGGGHTIVLDVSNKKILKFVDMIPDDGRGKIAAEIVRDYDLLDFQLQLLAELFNWFIVQHGTFDMASRPSPVTYPPKMEGFPTSELRFACDRVGFPDEVLAPPASRPDATEEELLKVDIAAKPEPAVAQPRLTPPDLVAAPAPIVVPTPVPVNLPEPAMAMNAPAVAIPVDTETISSVITALETEPAPKIAAVTSSPRDDRAKVESFYDSVARHCDLSMLITEQGDVVQFSDSAAGWFDIGPDIAKDMHAWVAETSKIMPGCQLVVMRSPILQYQSVIFMTNGSLTAFGAFSSHVTGRMFSIANEFVGRRR